MPPPTDRTTKRATNVSIRTDLLEDARAAGINLSALLEKALSGELQQLKRAKWREENRESIAAYNEHAAKSADALEEMWSVSDGSVHGV